MIEVAPIRVEVCVCTYRGALLDATLRSLARQKMPEGAILSILVIDNDNMSSAEPRVRSFAEISDIPVRYVHCPAGNISVARNGALDNCRGRYLAFIDDDEVASPDWIASLVETIRSTNADVVLGPVDAVYSPGAPAWMRRLDTHSTRPVEVEGVIRTGYTCNVLFDLASPAVAGLRFDPGLGRSGGEDTAFFSEVFARGGRFVHARQALVTETVPPERASLLWLARRRFRAGQTHGRLAAGRSRAAGIVLALAKIAYCGASALAGILSSERRNAALLRGCLHIGTLSGLVGMKPIELYGSTMTGASH